MSTDNKELPEWVDEIFAEYDLLGDNGPISAFTVEMAIKYIYSRMEEENNKLREGIEELKKSIPILNSGPYKCDYCGEAPELIMFTSKGKFCKSHVKY